MKTSEIRDRFLNYFSSKNHTIEPSSSLVPYNDKTLLFVNSGMVPFKDVFSGIENRQYTKAASCQRCVRAGGKHNDLENVGYTARHHTFFEMLGNFSFGDYFKEEAIVYAWEFLTKELKIPKEKLWVSVYEEDEEAEKIWIEKINFPKNRISRCGAKDNFWQMGDTGPCGPSSEIFYDHGEHIPGGPPGTADEDGDRFIEIWNLVFTQFDKQDDGYLKPLDKPCVDTGMGLERIAAVMQHKHNNYEIDIFNDICKKIITFTNNNIKVDNPSVRVIADHIRSASFLISDGVLPSNEGRGYVLRRIIRRGLRHGYKIGIDNSFFYLLSSIVAYQNKYIYPELQQNLALVEATIKNEEEKFSQTLDAGMKILENEINNLKTDVISGQVIFKLYDTYGFPYDLTADIAREHNLKLDENGFNKKMAAQKQRAREASNFNSENSVLIDSNTEFNGYDNISVKSTIIGIIDDNSEVNSIEDKQGIIILANTPFYAESGGQVGDTGVIKSNYASFDVVDTKEQKTGAILHIGQVNGVLKVGDEVTAKINKSRRDDIKRNHSATHLLHAALKKVLNENISQKGSLVDNNKLRFDFSYEKQVSNKDLRLIESMINQKILENTIVHTQIMDLDDAKKQGAMALFGEKYEEKVRVLTMGSNNFSMELCGGTHVDRLGDIGSFRIISQSSVSSGIRRIEAVTGFSAYEHDISNQNKLEDLAKILESHNVIEKATNLVETQKILNKQIDKLQKQLEGNITDELILQAKEINNIKVLSTKVENVKDLVGLMDKLKAKLKSSVVVLAKVENDKISIVSGVSADLVDNYNAGDILRKVATIVNGKGGGRADMARGGGSNVAKLDEALNLVFDLI